jgi:hypothetical protein
MGLGGGMMFQKCAVCQEFNDRKVKVLLFPGMRDRLQLADVYKSCISTLKA